MVSKLKMERFLKKIMLYYSSICIIMIFMFTSCELYEMATNDTKVEEFSLKDSRIFLATKLPSDLLASDFVAWQIYYLKPEGYVGKNIVSSTCDTVRLKVAKDDSSFVLAYPIIILENGDFFMTFPAGCVYPYSTKLDFFQGYTANLIMELSYDIASKGGNAHSVRDYFNWQKFSQTLALVMSEKHIATPWLFDTKLILSKIQTLSFSKVNIKICETAQCDYEDLCKDIKYMINLDENDDIIVWTQSLQKINKGETMLYPIDDVMQLLVKSSCNNTYYLIEYNAK